LFFEIISNNKNIIGLLRRLKKLFSFSFYFII
jgi:hypothetical protein